VSKALRYDALLARDLAAELDARLRGAAVGAVALDREGGRLMLLARGTTLVWALAPGTGWAIATAPDAAGAERIRARELPGRVSLAEGAVMGPVAAPHDERRVVFTLEAAGAPARIVVELAPNRWNAFVTASDGTVLDALRAQRGARPVERGARWEPEASSGRTTPTLEDWLALLGPLPAAERTAALVRGVAFTGPINAAAILGPAADAGFEAAAERRALEAAWRRWREVISGPRRPVLLRTGTDRVQPYGVALAGVPGAQQPSLLAAMLAAAREATGQSTAELVARRDERTAAAAARAHERAERARRRAERLAEELAGAARQADRLRALADLLLAQLHTVPRGAREARLDDFAGGSVTVELDPALSATENARALYQRAQKRARAAERLPSRVAAARREAARMGQEAARLAEGEATEAEIARFLPAPEAGGRGGRDAGVSLPYRRYRTTGGVEVRVGRGARGNDALTFHHSAPDDIWLHARDVGGAHVVLRWSGAGSPPQRDLAEAAVLAALHSKARTSGTVPVDWTRRKYVRKPRKAAPGLVLPDRVKTVFVEPDAALEERLRMEEA
jgi:hypothetical protein